MLTEANTQTEIEYRNISTQTAARENVSSKPIDLRFINPSSDHVQDYKQIKSSMERILKQNPKSLPPKSERRRNSRKQLTIEDIRNEGNGQATIDWGKRLKSIEQQYEEVPSHQSKQLVVLNNNNDDENSNLPVIKHKRSSFQPLMTPSMNL